MAVISLIQQDVLRYGWVTEQEFVDIVAISQVTPGPIGMNCATYVGYTVGGVWGSLLASAAIVLPSLLIMSTICYIYDHIRDRWQDNPVFVWTMRAIRLMVVVLIAHAAYTLMSPATFPDGQSWVIFSCLCVCCCPYLSLPNKVRPAASGWIQSATLSILFSSPLPLE